MEGESHLAEIRPASAGNNAIHGEGEQAAKQAAGESQENSFQHESEKDAEAGKTKSAQRSDLAGARRHDGVHGVHGAKHGANAHHHRNKNRQAEQRRGGRTGLVLVIAAFLFHFQLELRISFDIGIEAIERFWISQADGERILSAGAIEGGAHSVKIAPDLAFEGAALGSEGADDLEIALHHAHLGTHFQTTHAFLNALAHNDLVKTGTEVASFDDVDVVAHFESLGSDAADSDVGGDAVGAARRVGYDDHLG